jgi:hypothetical protein
LWINGFSHWAMSPQELDCSRIADPIDQSCPVAVSFSIRAASLSNFGPLQNQRYLAHESAPPKKN